MRLLLFTFLLSMTYAYSQARYPAVEPFVEIHTQQPKPDKPMGETPSFNFQNPPKMVGVETPATVGESSFTFTSLAILFLFLTLPFAMWFLVMSTLDKKNQERKKVELKIISKYDTDDSILETKDEDEEDDDDHKMAA